MEVLGQRSIRDRFVAWFLPKPTSFYRGVEVYRCRTDHVLVTDKSDLSLHAGHYVVTPIVLTLKEKILIWLKVIR